MTNPGAREAASLAALVHEQSAAEVQQLSADAQARAERIRAVAAAEVQSIRAAAEHEGEERGRRRAAALLAVAEASSRLELLRVRETLLDTALAETAARSADLATLPNAGAILADFIRDALQVLQSGPVRVRVRHSDEALLDGAALTGLSDGRWALHVEAGSVPGGGVIVETDDGRLRFDNSITARLNRQHDFLRQLAAKVLLAGTDGDLYDNDDH